MSNQSPGTPGQTDLVTLNRAATVARLLAGASHEVNNALQVIGGTTELLQMTPGFPESVMEGLKRIQGQNARAADALSAVVALARQQLDGRGRVDLRETVERSVGLRAFAIKRARLTIEVSAPAAGLFVVHASKPLLQLVVLNLIVNAEQALAGRTGGAIRVELEESGHDVLLRVSDNGPGVERGVADRIFEAFFTTRSREEASGLGLAVARLTAEQHGGTLTLEERHPGASFALRLPAGDVPR